MPGNRRRPWIVVVSALAIAVALVAARVYLHAPRRLGPGGDSSTTTISGPVGERMTTFVGGFRPHGSDPVRVLSVRLTDVPRGLRVVGIYGLEGGPPAGYQHGDPDPDVRARLRPVTDMVLREVPEGAREAWGVVVVLEAVEPGTWVTTGVDVTWKAGRHKGTTHYDYRLGMDVTR